MKQTHQTGPLSAITKFDRKPWRLCVLFVVILALLGVVSASASPAHFHSTTATGCDLCLTASLAATAQVVEAQTVPVPQAKGLPEIEQTSSLYELLLRHASRNRGPPSPAL